MSYSADNEAVAEAFAGAMPNTGWKRAMCPLCVDRTGKPDKRASMSLSTDTGRWNCHKCQTTGRLQDFADRWEPKLPGEPSGKAEPLGIDPPEGFTPLWAGPGLTAEATRPARDYLARRGVSGHAIAGCNVGVCLEGYCQGRIVVPHGYKAAGKWIGWIARDYVGDKELRYLYPKGMDRTVFWRQGELAVPTTAPVLLCEGVFDALPHYPHATAFLGKPIGAHVATLSTHRGRPLAVCLDGDAWEEGWALAQKLRLAGVPSVGAVRIPPGQDPGELSTAWMLSAARNSLLM